jgi:glycosyltransferase involved in cell wall biosynthesis
MRKIKILATMPTNTYGYAGAEKVVFNVLSGLDKNKFDIYLIEILRIRKSSNCCTFKFNTKFGIKYQIKTHRGLKAVPSLVKLIKKINPDIIYSNVTNTNFDTLLAKWLAFSQAKFISCVHGVNLNNFVDRIMLYFPSFFSYRIITVSNAIRELLIKKYKINPKKIITIYNPVINFEKLDIKINEKINPRNKIWPDRKFNVLVISRLEIGKGIGYLIEAINLIVHRNKRSDINLVIVGEGSLRKELTELVYNYKLKQYVFFIGWQNNVFKFLRESSILCLPSLREGLPTVLIEALACGLPIVSTDCLGSAELLEEGKYGILVKMKNSEELANGILRLLDDSNLREKYSQIGEVKAKDFSIQKIILQYEKFFEEIANNI